MEGKRKEERTKSRPPSVKGQHPTILLTTTLKEAMTEQNKSVTFQPGELGQSDRVSYESSDTHAREYCCCIHGWGSGPDPRWYYPWDKGVYRLWGLCCMWYCLCSVFPCALCFKESRDIICCADQCGNTSKIDTDTDQSKDDEIPIA